MGNDTVGGVGREVVWCVCGGRGVGWGCVYVGWGGVGNKRTCSAQSNERINNCLHDVQACFLDHSNQLVYM